MNERTNARSADWRALHGFLFFAYFVGATFVPVLRIWPWLWLGPLSAYGATVVWLRPLRVTFRPWPIGRFSRPAMAATLLIAAGSCAALIGFHRLAHPDVSGYAGFLPRSTLGGIVAVGVIFSVFNALLEEVIFRGILFDAFESQCGRAGAVLATAVLFGYGHMHGYPPGMAGAALAGIYGLCLGWLRVFDGGLGLPVLAHIAADTTIFVLVAGSGVLRS